VKKIALQRRRPVITLAYYWVGVPNFGDLLTPLLLKHFANLDVQWSSFPEATLVGVGSVIEHIPNGWSGRIVGSGKLHPDSPIPVGRTEILALRGPLTAKGVRGDFALGDPGLLASELVRVETKKYKLGLVPHWSDKSLATNPEFRRYAPIVIDPRGDPLEVIHKIGECEKIVTSSLHGLILADSFGIPRRCETTPRLTREGGTFKFRDYSEAVRTPFEVGKLIQVNRQAVDDRKSEIYDVLRALKP
jgi:pyruvyltransferase